MTMAYKALMVEAGPGAGTEARVRLAAKLAGECGAQLIGLAACAVRPPFMPPFGESVMVADIIEDDMRRVRAMLEAAGDRFRAIAGAAAEWRAFLEYPGDALAREARAAELVIIGRDAEARPAGVRQTAAPGDVLMRAGRPVLVVPPGVTGLAGRRVLVAWNESREARRAVIDALPLLARAERVQVLEICEPGEGAALGKRHVQDVAQLLLRHGARTSGEAVVRGGRSATAELLRAAERLDADLLVAGGYGHTRLSEWVFGGVTRDLLTACPICCLLSH